MPQAGGGEALSDSDSERRAAAPGLIAKHLKGVATGRGVGPVKLQALLQTWYAAAEPVPGTRWSLCVCEWMAASLLHTSRGAVVNYRVL